MELTAEELATMTGREAGQVSVWVYPIQSALAEFGIDTPQRQAAFLAQVIHESAGLARTDENLNYRAERLVAVWPNRFYLEPDEPNGRHLASDYASNPQNLANLVYAGRMGNGDEASGDGWRFRGRGLMQITGRALYTELAQALGLDLLNNPDALLEPLAAARAAGWYWQRINGNAFADQDSDEAFAGLTKAINGQTLGLEHRHACWELTKSCLQCA